CGARGRAPHAAAPGRCAAAAEAAGATAPLTAARYAAAPSPPSGGSWALGPELRIGDRLRHGLLMGQCATTTAEGRTGDGGGKRAPQLTPPCICSSSSPRWGPAGATALLQGGGPAAAPSRRPMAPTRGRRINILRFLFVDSTDTTSILG
ncbi:unnamed protein product, partial [Prorocentrum cordatum]